MDSLQALTQLGQELTKIQRSTIQMNQLIQMPNAIVSPEASQNIIQISAHLAHHIAEAGAQFADEIEKLAQLRAANSSAAAALRETTTHPTAPMSPGRAAVGEAAVALTREMLAGKIGPDFMAGVERVEAKRAAGPTLTPLTKAPEPTAARPGPTLATTASGAAQAASKQAEQERTGLIDLLIGTNGLLARWFSSGVWPAASGVISPIYGQNLFEEDIRALTYDTLNAWPEGFYRNASTSAFQYLIKTHEMLMVIDFGALASDVIETRLNSVEVYFHNDTSVVKMRRPIATFGPELLRNIIKDADGQLRFTHSGK